MDNRCNDCIYKTWTRLFNKFQTQEALNLQFIEFYHNILATKEYSLVPEIQRVLNRRFCSLFDISDPFFEEKRMSNQKLIELYPKYKKELFDAKNPYEMALRLSIAGNIMDYGANNSFEINETIHFVLNSEFAIDQSQLLHQKIKEAKRILYLADNAGEIVFDKLFLETIMHNDVVVAVKAGAILNDATRSDAIFTGIDKVADIIDNGYDAPSTILEYCGSEFLDIYHSADLIISKGQGNFEGLIKQNDSRIFFLLMAKCDVIAEILNVKRGSFVVYNQKFS